MATEFAQLLKEAAGEPPQPLNMAFVRARAARLGVRRRVALWLSALAVALGIAVPAGVSLVPSGDRGTAVRTIDNDPDRRRPSEHRRSGAPTTVPRVMPPSAAGGRRHGSPADSASAQQAPSVAGDRVAFTSGRNVYISDPANPGGRLVAQYAHSPTWSPDGRRLALILLRNHDGLDPSGDRHVAGSLATMDADGGNLHMIRWADAATDDLGFKGWSIDSPAWSPNGATIAFVQRFCGELWGGGGTFGDESCRPGQVGDVAESPNQVPSSQLRALRVDTGAEQVLASTGRNTFNESPTWSPDGRRIAYAHSDDGHAFAVYVANADGSGATNLTQAAMPGYLTSDPAWSPDGRWIAVAATGPGNSVQCNIAGAGITLIAVDGSSHPAVTGITTPCNSKPAWTPDGTQLLYSNYASASDSDELWIKRITAISKDQAAGPVSRWRAGSDARVAPPAR